MNWEREGRDWPHRNASRFVQAGGLRWHVQQMGTGPLALLMHGTGASTHSWRHLMPLLARRHTVLAMDLPGHAYTGTPAAAQLSLPGMAAAVAELIKVLALDVSLVVAHSAGAAIAARLVLDGAMQPQHMVAINGAFLPLSGLPGLLFPPVARLMAGTRLAPQLFARRTWDSRAVERLIAGTGSSLDAQGLALYGTLLRNAGHAAGALGMMANWDLQPLQRELPQLKTPLHLVVGANDKAVPPHDARRVQALLPSSTLTTVRGAGHLVHEESQGMAAEVASLITRAHQGSPA